MSTFVVLHADPSAIASGKGRTVRAFYTMGGPSHYVSFVETKDDIDCADGFRLLSSSLSDGDEVIPVRKAFEGTQARRDLTVISFGKWTQKGLACYDENRMKENVKVMEQLGVSSHEVFVVKGGAPFNTIAISTADSLSSVGACAMASLASGFIRTRAVPALEAEQASRARERGLEAMRNTT